MYTSWYDLMAKCKNHSAKPIRWFLIRLQRLWQVGLPRDETNSSHLMTRRVWDEMSSPLNEMRSNMRQLKCGEMRWVLSLWDDLHLISNTMYVNLNETSHLISCETEMRWDELEIAQTHRTHISSHSQVRWDETRAISSHLVLWQP